MVLAAFLFVLLFSPPKHFIEKLEVVKMVSWKDVKAKYEEKYGKILDLSTPELVEKYIEKYSLSSDVMSVLLKKWGDL